LGSRLRAPIGSLSGRFSKFGSDLRAVDDDQYSGRMVRQVDSRRISYCDGFDVEAFCPSIQRLLPSSCLRLGCALHIRPAPTAAPLNKECSHAQVSIVLVEHACSLGISAQNSPISTL
jgi:hypothetical protein